MSAYVDSIGGGVVVKLELLVVNLMNSRGAPVRAGGRRIAVADDMCCSRLARSCPNDSVKSFVSVITGMVVHPRSRAAGAVNWITFPRVAVAHDVGAARDRRRAAAGREVSVDYRR